MHATFRFNLTVTIVVGGGAVLAWAYAIYKSVAFWSIPPAVLALPLALTVLFALGWTLSVVSARIADGHTRCRRCSHILRGLSEPVCPECGERI